MIMLGDKVKDTVSGLVGIATAKTEYLNGCVQYGVSIQLKKNETELKTYYIDKEQLVVIKPKRKPKAKSNGGMTQLMAQRPHQDRVIRK